MEGLSAVHESTSTIRPLYLRVDAGDIAYLKFLFESYEEVAIVRTVDRHAAIIVILVAEDFLADAQAILADAQAVVACEMLPEPPVDKDDWLMREIDDE